MKVEELMTKTVSFCSQTDTLERAARLMWDGDCGCLPVCAANGAQRVVGMITDRDICMAALFQARPLRDLLVSDAMAKQVVTCRADDALAGVEKRMREARVRRLPVVDAQDGLVGIIALADIAREAARERTLGTRDVTDSEVRETLSSICASRGAQQALHQGAG
jgi:CBS domain-containing protein